MSCGADRLSYFQGAVSEWTCADQRRLRKKRFDEMVATMYQRGKALNNASHFGVDDVIDPADSRRWIASGLKASGKAAPREGKKHRYIDSW